MNEQPSTNGEMRNRVQAIRLDSQLGASKSGRSSGAAWLPWMLTAILAVSWAGVGVRWYRTAPVEVAAPVAGTTGTSSSSSANSSGAIVLAYAGYLMPAKKIAVSPIDVGGRLISSSVVEGKYYKQGEILAEIDPASYKAVYDEATAAKNGAQQRFNATRERLDEMKPASVRPVEIEQLKAQLNEAVALQSRAATEFVRIEGLKATSTREVQQAESDKLAADARVAKLNADMEILIKGPRKERIAAAQADMDAAAADLAAASFREAQAKWRLDNCTIRAPVSGTVLTKIAEQFNLVNPMAFGAGSGAVCDMADLTDLEADLKIPEREISKLQVGQPANIRSKSFPDRVYEGRLDRIMPIANRGDNTVNIRVKVKLPEGEIPGTYLKPEMGADVSFLPMK